METSCIDLGIPTAGDVEEKKKQQKLLQWVKFSFYGIVDHEIFTYLKNKK